MNLVVIPGVISLKLLLLEESVTVIESKQQGKGHNIHLYDRPYHNLVSWHKFKANSDPDIKHNEEEPLKATNDHHLSVFVSAIWNVDELQKSRNNDNIQQIGFCNHNIFTLENFILERI